MNNLKLEGYTYPKILDNNFVLYFWKKFFCPIGWHLWDEYISIENHCLYCDACEREVEIKSGGNNE